MTNNKKVLLDTSVQIDKFITPSTETQLQELIKNKEIYTSYYVYFEFKAGLIKSLIDFYLLVNITDPSTAFSKWSQKFSSRDLKNSNILLALMSKIFKTIEVGNKERYLAQIETVIFHLLNNFHSNIRGIVGSFRSNTVVKFNIFSKNDFQPFLKHLNKHNFIPHQAFWLSHKKELDLLTSNKDLFQNTDALKKIYNHLTTIQAEIDKADKFTQSKGLGDAVIVVDAPNDYALASLDHSFEVLCSLLTKELHIIVKN